MNTIELFKKKMSIVSRVSVSPELNFGKLLRECALSVLSLKVLDDSRFPYANWKTKEEDKHGLRIEHLKVNWEDDKREDGFCKSSAWSTYSGCTSVDIYYDSTDDITIEVSVWNGDSLSGDRADLRFTVVFVVKDFDMLLKKHSDDVDRAFTRHATYIREKEIEQEEKAKILAIETRLLEE